MKTNKMNTVVSLNWKVADIVREKLSFDLWHKRVLGCPASQKVLNNIKSVDLELKQMKAAVILAARDQATT